MGEEGVRPPSELFELDLRRALYHLYDPDDLRRNPVFVCFTSEHHGSPSALRDFLLGAIAKLKPAAGVSPDSSAWRTYRLLQHRFVEQFDQARVATNLGLSIRQMRRQEKQALQALADSLWRSYDLAARYGQRQSPEKAEPAIGGPSPVITRTPAVEQSRVDPEFAQELSWLDHSMPREPADVEQLVKTTLDTAESLLQTLQVTAICEVPAGLPAVEVQAGPIRQVLLMLFSEAIRSAPGGRLMLTANAEAQQIAISVLAIVEHHAPDIARSGAKSARLGTAQRLASLSGGSLAILPRQSDVAFAANLLLPCVAPITVLFIDDNADTQRLFSRYLAHTRYAYYEERDARQAMGLAEAIAPQIIVLDVMLPGIDGWEVLGRLCTHPRTAEIPVIICSILPLDQLAISLGAAAVLQKPVTREKLLRCLDQQADALARGSR